MTCVTDGQIDRKINDRQSYRTRRDGVTDTEREREMDIERERDSAQTTEITKEARSMDASSSRASAAQTRSEQNDVQTHACPINADAAVHTVCWIYYLNCQGKTD